MPDPPVATARRTPPSTEGRSVMTSIVRLIGRCRRSVILLAVVAAASAFAGQSSAARPFIGALPLSETFVDDGASAACGFPVTSTISGTARVEVFFVQGGNPVRVQVEESTSG